MRVFVFFDLPTQTFDNLRDYRIFRKYLIRNGFIMLQESVYCKLALNQTAVDNIYESLRKNKPPLGLVQVMSITEKQFAKSEYLVGQYSSDVIDSDERLIIL
jgi:CRISPR-associated protein Cas2